MKYDFTSIPVVDGENRLVGIITVDDIVDILQQEATEEEVKGSGSVMSTFLADMHQLFTRHFLWMKS